MRNILSTNLTTPHCDHYSHLQNTYSMSSTRYEWLSHSNRMNCIPKDDHWSPKHLSSSIEPPRPSSYGKMNKFLEQIVGLFQGNLQSSRKNWNLSIWKLKKDDEALLGWSDLWNETMRRLVQRKEISQKKSISTMHIHCKLNFLSLSVFAWWIMMVQYLEVHSRVSCFWPTYVFGILGY